ncbi:TRAP transporter small permease subunit [uncultured Cohaesibacter sp.]|uniref:TRAP transporter small permease subunit n=1 Tax=uncultured Cohaesibacter sp. TaxID=1002546 RepID=UPI00292CB399|nr:TRAP transporter small permease subunit [uncultured Cohaesibacter sp.]
MKGAAVAVIGCLCAVLAFFAPALYAGPLLLLSAITVFMACCWRTRPILLLISYILFAYAFISVPQGLPGMLEEYGLDLRILTITDGVLIALGGSLSVVLFFALSCKRQSGGVRLSAQEVSEDIGRIVGLVARLVSLLYLPLLLLPLYLLFHEADLNGISEMELLDWGKIGSPDQSGVSGGIVPNIVAWMVAILFMGGLASAYMRDDHHRFTRLRRWFGPSWQAWIELIGSITLLLPLCWVFIILGWHHADMRFELGNAVSLLTIARLPDWLLYSVFPVSFLLLAAAAVAIMFRSLVYLFGPPYLKKRAATHLDPTPDLANQSYEMAERSSHKGAHLG